MEGRIDRSLWTVVVLKRQVREKSETPSIISPGKDSGFSRSRTFEKDRIEGRRKRTNTASAELRPPRSIRSARPSWMVHQSNMLQIPHLCRSKTCTTKLRRSRAEMPTTTSNKQQEMFARREFWTLCFRNGTSWLKETDNLTRTL